MCVGNFVEFSNCDAGNCTSINLLFNPQEANYTIESIKVNEGYSLRRGVFQDRQLWRTEHYAPADVYSATMPEDFLLKHVGKSLTGH